MDAMKGQGRTLISCHDPRRPGRLDLVSFGDGSWAVRKDDRTVGVWEPEEQDQGFNVFWMLTGLGRHARGESSDLIVILRSSDHITANMN